jgi:hypothetical protein
MAGTTRLTDKNLSPKQKKFYGAFELQDVAGPTTVNINSANTWSISAYDPDGMQGSQLRYKVNWGDETITGAHPASGEGVSSTFQHT